MSVDVTHPLLEMDLADRMRKCLRIADISVTEIADEIGVHRNTVSSWLGGRVTPPLPVQKLWAIRFREFGVTLRWLQTGQAPTNGGPDGVAGPGFEPGTSGLQVGADTPEHFVPMAPAA